MACGALLGSLSGYFRSNLRWLAMLMLALFALAGAGPEAGAQSCAGASVSTLSQLNNAIDSYNAFCGSGDQMVVVVSGTIAITGGGTAMIDNGSGAVLKIMGGGTLDGRGNRLILDVVAGVVVLENMGLIAGRSFSGAIRNLGGDVSILQSTLTGNSGVRGGAIYNNSGASLSIFASTLQDNEAGEKGGAIYNQGSLVVEGSAFVHNSAVEGGALYNDGGAVRIANSTFSGNATTSSLGVGGAIYYYRLGGSLEIAHATITENYASFAGAGIYVFTPFGSGTPIDTNIRNTIIANGSAGDCGGQIGIGSSGKNYDGDGSCVSLAGPHFSTATAAELNLGPLGDYGGPTQTHVLRLPSVALNRATDCLFPWGGLVESDQRGFQRPFGSACDVGAFELGALDSMASWSNGDPDGNGSVDPIDARLCTQEVLLPQPPAPGLFPPCDANDDGELGGEDLTLIGDTYLGIDRLLQSAAVGLGALLIAALFALPGRKRTRLASALLLVLMSLSLTGCALFAPGTPGLFAVMGNQFISIGVQNMPGGGLASFAAQSGGFSYDPSLFHVIALLPASGFELISSLIDNASGQVLWVLVNPQGGVTNGYVLELQITDVTEVQPGALRWDPARLFLADDANALIPAGSFQVFPKD